MLGSCYGFLLQLARNILQFSSEIIGRRRKGVGAGAPSWLEVHDGLRRCRPPHRQRYLAPSVASQINWQFTVRLSSLRAEER